jgi:biopolymer transport protein ExbD
MRLPLHLHRSGDSFDSSMTPMIDVVFLLMIFFICTAGFQAPEESLPTTISPPSGAGTQVVNVEQEELEPVIVWIQETQDQVRVGDVVCRGLPAVRAALDRLARVSRDLPVILRIDPPVPMDRVVAVYDVCRLAGFKRVQFAASQRHTAG